MIAGRYAAFVNLWQAGPTNPDILKPILSFRDESGRRFGRINVEMAYWSTGFLGSQRYLARCILLLGNDQFDSGNMIGFLRQTCPLIGQRFAIYKSCNDRSGYLIGTEDGVVRKKKQSVCIGDFKAENFPVFFELLRGGADQIEVERIRFPYRRPHIRGELEH